MHPRVLLDENHPAVLATTALCLNVRLSRLRRFQVRLVSSIREGCISEEHEKLNRVFNQSRSRLTYANVGLVVVLVLAGLIEICIGLLGY
jgi:hypothetical protein